MSKREVNCMGTEMEGPIKPPCSCQSSRYGNEVWQISSVGPEVRGRDANRAQSRPREPSQVRGRSESRGRQQGCFHCGGEGHIKRECRKLLNQCFVCGSSEHRIAQCPNRRTSDSIRTSTPSQENSFQPHDRYGNDVLPRRGRERFRNARDNLAGPEERENQGNW